MADHTFAARAETCTVIGGLRRGRLEADPRELQEFWDEVRLKTGTREGQLQELIQTAAMAQRTAEDLGLIRRPAEDRLRELLGDEVAPSGVGGTDG